jgi:hypothetical protein
MKTNKLTLGILLGLGLASSASAVNFVYVVGSTAFRSAAFSGITNSFDAVPQIATRDGSAASGNNANWMLFHGNVSGVETWVNCHWSGAEDGMAATAVPGPNPSYFLKTDGSVTYSISTSLPGAAETNAVPTAPDLTFADGDQSVSLTPTPALVKMGTNAVPDGKVGIIPFIWAKNKNLAPSNSWLRITNMTDQMARAALGGPNIAALFTGDPSDTNQYVYCVGRNNRSGTRTDTCAITKYGIRKPVDQFTIGGYPVPTGTTLLLEEAPGSYGSDDGYDSGAYVQRALQVDGSCQQTDPIYFANTGNTKTGWIAIGYMGVGDAKNLQTAGGVWLTYNGVAVSNQAIEEGQYPFWNTEILYGRVGISGFQQTYGNKLASIYVPSQLGGTSPTAIDSGIKLSLMHATRPTSGTGDISHN